MDIRVFCNDHTTFEKPIIVEILFPYIYQAIRRGTAEPTDIELKSCMRGEAPGSPDDLCMLSFDSGFHGRTLGKKIS